VKRERLRKTGGLLALTVALLWIAAPFSAIFLGGCAHYTINAPAAALDSSRGYKFGVADALPGIDDEVFVILALSGGGTRAAAFSFGVMEGLREIHYTKNGQTHSLLNDVHLISSVSGGSFTAAYYGLHSQEEFFTTFPNRFLYPNVELALGLSLLNPVNWVKLASPYYSRIDLAADYYDAHLFDHKKFADLAMGAGHPFIVLNSTDTGFVGRFEFTQDQFDVLGSDLNSYPVARGVAASSAFPFLLCPLTLRDYVKQSPNEPQWIVHGLKDRVINERSYATAVQNHLYYDVKTTQYVHLLDGGLADNIGLRGPAGALEGDEMPWTLQAHVNGRIKTLVVIVVDAHTEEASELAQKESTPGLVAVLGTVTSGPMSNYSSDTIYELQDYLTRLKQDYSTNGQLALTANSAPLGTPPNIYMIPLSFADVADEERRGRLNHIGTNYSVDRGDVDLLRATGKRLIEEAPEQKRLIADLQKGP